MSEANLEKILYSLCESLMETFLKQAKDVFRSNYDWMRFFTSL